MPRRWMTSPSSSSGCGRDDGLALFFLIIFGSIQALLSASRWAGGLLRLRCTQCTLLKGTRPTHLVMPASYLPNSRPPVALRSLHPSHPGPLDVPNSKLFALLSKHASRWDGRGDVYVPGCPVPSVPDLQTQCTSPVSCAWAIGHFGGAWAYVWRWNVLLRPRARLHAHRNHLYSVPFVDLCVLSLIESVCVSVVSVLIFWLVRRCGWMESVLPLPRRD